MGTLLVPVSFGLLGIALNKYSGAEFSLRGKAILGAGSIFLFSFWVYASRLYKLSTDRARDVLMKIETTWKVDAEMSLFTKQQPILDMRFKLFGLPYKLFLLPYGLFALQKITLGALVLIWVLILYLRL
jgi:hypothetical protein